MTYADTLARAALDAQAPRRPDAPTVISTFAGRGGSSTGYHMAGYRELLAVEWDDHAVATLRLNYPDLDVWQGDIAQLTVPDVLTRTGLQVGELDLFDGSPPCQGFSTAGRRAMDDPRNQLFREYTRLLRGLMPRTFVMENVTGLAKGKMKTVFAEILQELKACGYQVTAGVVNAAYLGVPQARERVIFIGCREDLGLTPTLPTPQTRFITAAQALADLPVRPTGPGLMTAQKWINVWARVQPGHDFASIHPKGNLFNYLKLSPDRPVGTITKTITTGNGGPGIYHWKYPRLLNIEELTRLGSFPDTYRWPGDPANDQKDHMQAWAGIGNAVPPLMARAIGLYVRNTLLRPPAQQENSVDQVT